MQHQSDGTAHHGDVGDVEDRPPLQVDEVDHSAAEEPVVGPKQPVDQVADRSADDAAEQHTRHPVLDGTRVVNHPDDDEQDHDAEPPAQTSAHAERDPEVVDQPQSQRPEEIDRAILERSDRKDLRDLVDGDDRRGRGRDDVQSSTVGADHGGLGGLDAHLVVLAVSGFSGGGSPPP